MKKFIFLFLASTLLMLSACGEGETEGEISTIVLADAGWDSIRVHNSIAQKIIEEGFGYNTDVTAGSTSATIQGLRNGDINVYMEVGQITFVNCMRIRSNLEILKQSRLTLTIMLKGYMYQSMSLKATRNVI